MKQEQNKYKGLTKRQYKRTHGSTTPGSEKGFTCTASGLDKALTKYPRAHKTMPNEYYALMRKQQLNGKNFPINSLFLT